jgi:hypothetical protein
MAGPNFVGKAGQLAVMAEFLLRGYNVAMPEVDVGDDIFVVNDGVERLWRIQEKTAIGLGRVTDAVANIWCRWLSCGISTLRHCTTSSSCAGRATGNSSPSPKKSWSENRAASGWVRSRETISFSTWPSGGENSFVPVAAGSTTATTGTCGQSSGRSVIRAPFPDNRVLPRIFQAYAPHLADLFHGQPGE